MARLPYKYQWIGPQLRTDAYGGEQSPATEGGTVEEIATGDLLTTLTNRVTEPRIMVQNRRTKDVFFVEQWEIQWKPKSELEAEAAATEQKKENKENKESVGDLSDDYMPGSGSNYSFGRAE